MRIIGGTLKGKSILPPVGYKARPTTDFAKEGLFNVLQNEVDFEGCTVLDLFSGTGGISYEFASRGCPRVVAVEMNPAHCAFIKKTSAQFGLGRTVQVAHSNVFDFLGLCRETYDIVFADPPYAIEGLDTIPEKVFSHGLVKDGGYLILEHPGDYRFTSDAGFVKEKRYGNVHFSFFSPGPQDK